MTQFSKLCGSLNKIVTTHVTSQKIFKTKKKSYECCTFTVMPFKVRNKTITFQDVTKFITSLAALVMVLFGVSLATTFKNIRQVFQTPQKIDQLIENDRIIFNHIKETDYSHEMVWELFRIMTDDIDTCRWYYADEAGVAKNVDIRETAERVELAFVFEGHEIYPVFDSPADDRKYVIRRNGDQENYITYLFCRD